MRGKQAQPWLLGTVWVPQMAVERDYVLGTHDDEAQRLGLQHRVWRPYVQETWKRARLGKGQTIYDIGCGPGHASLDLAEVVGSAGLVIAIDQSSRFLQSLNDLISQMGLSNITKFELDLDTDELPNVVADAAWCRWVLAFVKQPKHLLKRICERIRPGGLFVSYEYYDYLGWRHAPVSEPFERFVQRIYDAWRDSGGNPDVGTELPAWLEQIGFEIESARTIQHVADRRHPIWEWPATFMEVGLDRLLAIKAIDANEAEEYWQEIVRIRSNPGSRFITPGVLELIARRP